MLILSVSDVIQIPTRLPAGRRNDRLWVSRRCQRCGFAIPNQHFGYHPSSNRMADVSMNYDLLIIVTPFKWSVFLTPEYTVNIEPLMTYFNCRQLAAELLVLSFIYEFTWHTE
jgi:hypothetical protein